MTSVGTPATGRLVGMSPDSQAGGRPARRPRVRGSHPRSGTEPWWDPRVSYVPATGPGSLVGPLVPVRGPGLFLPSGPDGHALEGVEVKALRQSDVEWLMPFGMM